MTWGNFIVKDFSPKVFIGVGGINCVIIFTLDPAISYENNEKGNEIIFRFEEGIVSKWELEGIGKALLGKEILVGDLEIIKNSSSSTIFTAEGMKLKSAEDYRKLVREFVGENVEIDFGTIQNLAEVWRINKNIMVNKTYILEWENTELKDGVTPYEKFKIVAGEDKENLSFFSNFFSGNIRFKKGDIYQFSTSGGFIEDKTGIIPGSFNDSGIIQGISDGNYELKKLTPSLLIKELWEKKEKLVKELDLSERDLKSKKEDVSDINQKWLDSKNEIVQLKGEISNLCSEREKSVEEASLLREELKRKKEELEKSGQVLVNTKQELSDLQGNFNKVQSEKTKIENERMTPERQNYLLQEQENLKKELEIEKNKKQDLINQLEEIHDQSWKERIQEKLKEEKSRLNHLKISVGNELEISQKVFLETLLVIQEQFNNLIFEGVDQRICSPMKNQLQSTKDKLVDENKKVSLEEIESLCEVQTEIAKLEFQQKQWDKLEKIQEQEQQLRAYVEVK